jgi:hypothetical protein
MERKLTTMSRPQQPQPHHLPNNLVNQKSRDPRYARTSNSQSPDKRIPHRLSASLSTNQIASDHTPGKEAMRLLAHTNIRAAFSR